MGASKSKNRAPARVSKIPKTQKTHPKVWIFGNSSGSLKIQKPKIPRLSKNPKIPTQVSGFWKLEREPQNPKTQNSSSFQKSQNPKNPPQGLGFWKLEREHEFWIFRLPLEFPKTQTLGWNFWIFGNSRNFGFQKTHPKVWILETRAGASKSKNRAPARVSENPKIQKTHPKVWIFGNSSGSTNFGL